MEGRPTESEKEDPGRAMKAGGGSVGLCVMLRLRCPIRPQVDTATCNSQAEVTDPESLAYT